VALPDLATAADLTARGIDINPSGVDVNALLAAASAEVRSAAGVPISRTTWTMTIPGVCGEWLRLPGQPVVSVAAVAIDGNTVTDWKLVGGHLWRECGWQRTHTPVNVTATVTGGLVEVPKDIVDLTCSLVGTGIAAAEDGYESKAGKAYESIDDYRVGYEQGPGQTAGIMELPEATRVRLRARFGGGAGLVTSR
jgi:hypothetical protein